MTNIKPLYLLPPIIFFILAIIMFIGLGRENPNELPSQMVGRSAPNLTISPLSELPFFDETDLKASNIKIVNFWASWCPPCRAEHPKLLEMAANGLPIIGVNFRDKASAAANYLDDDGNPFVAVAFDPEGKSAIDWGVTAPPETFILAADGTVLFRYIGPLVGSDYEQRFLPELEEALVGSRTK